MKNNKDCRVGQLTTSAGSTSVERFPQDNSCNVLFLSFRFLTIVHDVGAICAEWHRVLYLNGQKLPYGPPLEWRNTQNMFFMETLEFGDARVNIWKRFE